MAQERVLLVDDGEDFLAVLKGRLEARGLVVSTATNGPDAIGLSKENKFDAIILDLLMPGMDGIEVLRAILAQDPDAQIILLTGHGSVRSGVEAIKEGAADFLEKPADFQELLARIGEAAIKRTVLLEERSMEQIEDILKRKGW